MDPILIHSRRESRWILAIWSVFAIWVIGYSGMNGYHVAPDQLTLVLGMPSWVFWGIGAPWCLANVVTILFSFLYMTDHALGEEDAQARERIESDAH